MKILISLLFLMISAQTANAEEQLYVAKNGNEKSIPSSATRLELDGESKDAVALLSRCTLLTEIRITGWRPKAEVFAKLASFTKLEVLHVYSQKDVVPPSSLRELVNLRVLYLIPKIAGEVRSGFGAAHRSWLQIMSNFKNLVEVNIGGTKDVYVEDIKLLANLTNLKMLTLSFSLHQSQKISDADYAWLKALKSLEHLELDGPFRGTDGSWIKFLEKHKKMRVLLLPPQGRLNSTAIAVIKNMKNLESLVFANGLDVTAKEFATLSKLKRLKYVDLGLPKDLDLFTALGKFKNLESTRLYRYTTKASIKALGKAPKLRIVELAEWPAKNERWDYLSELKKVEHVKVNFGWEMNAVGGQEFQSLTRLKSMKSLKHLSVTVNRNIPFEEIKKLSEIKNLEKLTLVRKFVLDGTLTESQLAELKSLWKNIEIVASSKPDYIGPSRFLGETLALGKAASVSKLATSGPEYESFYLDKTTTLEEVQVLAQRSGVLQVSFTSGAQVTSEWIELISGMGSIRSIRFSRVKVTPELIGQLAKLPALERMQFLNMSLKNLEFFDAFAAHDSLSNLGFEMSTLPDNFGAHFGGIPKLKELYVSQCRGVNKLSYGAVAGYAALETLCITDNNDNITTANIQAWAAMPNLTSLTFNSQGKANDVAFEAIAKNMKIKKLGIIGQFTDRALKLLSGHPTLESLSFRGQNYNGEGLENCPNLNYLDLSNCLLTDEAIRCVATNTKLTCLTLNGDWTKYAVTTNTGLKHLSALKSIKSLMLYRMPEVTDEAFSFLDGMKDLRTLLVQESRQVRGDFLLKLVDKPHLSSVLFHKMAASYMNIMTIKAIHSAKPDVRAS